ncbi:MAG: complex I NDUFA9 subunit family protein [Betaproteobacteria bacterium]|nr:complex I NDUFA9 subunit family protein [Betaproteobacteria bacterium]
MNTVIFGGSGFVGSRLARLLVEAGGHVTIPTRDRERAKRNLIVLPNTDLVGCDPTNARSVETLCNNADVVINLLGVLHETSNASFEKIHVDCVRLISDAASRSGRVRHLLHVSAINATPGAPSKYLRSKGKGEALISKLRRPNWTIIRPSLLFGEGSDFCALVRWQIDRLPVLALPCAAARFQPLHVDDLARMIAGCIFDPQVYGKALLAGGPDKLSLREIYDAFQAVAGRKRVIVPLPPSLSGLMAGCMELVPFLPPLLTRDNVASMSLPKVCEAGNGAERIDGQLISLADFLAATRLRQDSARALEYRRFRHGARRG